MDTGTQNISMDNLDTMKINCYSNIHATPEVYNEIPPKMLEAFKNGECSVFLELGEDYQKDYTSVMAMAGHGDNACLDLAMMGLNFGLTFYNFRVDQLCEKYNINLNKNIIHTDDIRNLLDQVNPRGTYMVTCFNFYQRTCTNFSMDEIYSPLQDLYMIDITNMPLFATYKNSAISLLERFASKKHIIKG